MKGERGASMYILILFIGAFMMSLFFNVIFAIIGSIGG